MLVQKDMVLEGCVRDLLEIHQDTHGHSPVCEITDHAAIAGYVMAYDKSTVNMRGGRICHELVGTDDSVVNLFEGHVGGVNACLHATVNVSGGEINDEIFVTSGGTVHWSGGFVSGSLLVATDSAVVHVYGRSLCFGPDKTIWGRLKDGTLIGPQHYDLLLGAQRRQIILHSDDNLPEHLRPLSESLEIEPELALTVA